MTTPPDFGGTEIEEGLREDFGVRPQEHGTQAPGETCARCGNQIMSGQDSRRRADGRWVHEVCPFS